MRRRALAAVAAAALALLAPAAHARSAGEIAAAARAIGGATGDAASEQARIARLGELVLAFIARSDEAARSGSEPAQRAALRGAFEAIEAPLESIYGARSRRLEALARAVMEQDGDLEALYETAEFTEAQAVAAAALYYRNWLAYYGARLYDGERRATLLSTAEQGFSQLAVGEQQPELISESLLGRGLCHLELGDTAATLRDFALVLETPGVPPERAGKARLARLDAYARAGRTPEALRYSDELLRRGDVAAADVPLVRFVRLQMLVDATAAARGAEAERQRREAAELMAALRAAGPGWAGRVDALLATRIDDPRAWADAVDAPRAHWELARSLLARNDYDGALPLLTQLVASADPEAQPLHPDAQYWLGVVRMQRGELTAAADAFDAALVADADWTAEARYLRFKALEQLMAESEGEAAPAARYEAALRDLLTRAPQHPRVWEAQYRLGELLQARGEFALAIEAYAGVRGDPVTELRARFGTLQSRFELLARDVDPPVRAARLAAIGTDLDAIDAQRRGLEEPSPGVDEIGARTTLLRAVYLGVRATPESDEQIAALLGDFEQQFPAQRELLAQAVRLRLGALQRLGRYAEAERVADQYRPALAAETRPVQLEKLAADFDRAAMVRREAGDADGSTAAARTALALYALTGVDGEPARQLKVAELKEATGDLSGAAAIYRGLVGDPHVPLARAGLARVEESQGRLAEALAHWAAYTGSVRRGDARWIQGEYQQARLTLALGDPAGACDRLTKLRPMMPAVADADLRRQLGELHDRACQ